MNKIRSKTIFTLALMGIILSFQSRNNLCLAQEDNKSELNYSIKLDTNIINIGDQINLDISFRQPKHLKIDFPVLADTIPSGIEIIHQQKMDTTILENELIQVLKRYKITSFDAGIHKIHPFKFSIINKNFTKEFSSDTLMMAVRTMEIDNTKGPADIIMPINTPLNFDEIYPYLMYILIGLVCILLVILGIYIYTRRKDNKNLFGKQEIEEEAHVVALRSLEKIKKDDLCNKGLIKEYHSRLTDTMKLYLDKRFELSTIESTTDDILRVIKNHQDIDKAQEEELKFIFQTADLAKFAKFIPMNDDNYRSFSLSLKFVEQTIKVEEENKEEKTSKDENNIEERK